MRKRLALLVAAVMMFTMSLSGAAFAQGGSENSCGAANPNIDVPAHHGNKGDEFEDCGFRNNPHGGPPGHEE